MTPSFSIERRQAAEVVSWIRDRIPEQKGNAREIGSQRKEKKFLPSPPRRRGRFPRVTYHGASPPMIFLLPPHRPSLRSSFDGKDHACAQNDVLHARSRAHTQNVCARASDLRSYSLSCLIFL